MTMAKPRSAKKTRVGCWGSIQRVPESPTITPTINSPTTTGMRSASDQASSGPASPTATISAKPA
jgi:hypothetical protein